MRIVTGDQLYLSPGAACIDRMHATSLATTAAMTNSLRGVLGLGLVHGERDFQYFFNPSKV